MPRLLFFKNGRFAGHEETPSTTNPAKARDFAYESPPRPPRPAQGLYEPEFHPHMRVSNVEAIMLIV
jgi:hypothetical protein